jgi:hypothetical protein
MKFLTLFLGRGCTHRFSWPRIDDSGHHYQICADCGTAYEYDWKMMRRTQQLLIKKARYGEAAASLMANAARS